MFQWLNWKGWSHRRQSGRRFITISRLGFALGLAAMLFMAYAVAPVCAQSPIRVLKSDVTYTFSEAIEFSLDVEGTQPVTSVILFYGRTDSPLARRIYPQFVPGAQVRVDHTEELESGQYAPGTSLRVWWQIDTASGDTLTTDAEAFEYTDRAQDWKILSGERISYYWYGSDEDRAQMLLQRGEEAISRLQSEVGVFVERPVRVYAYNDQQDMGRALARRSEVYDDRVLTLGVAVGDETLLLLAGHRDAEMVIAHELSHLIVGMATDNPYAGLPRWLDEGLAMYAEGAMPSDNQRALDKAVRQDDLLTIRSMSSYSGQASQVDLYYGQAYSVLDFMLEEYGREKLLQLLDVFAEGSRQEDALDRVYGLSLDTLDARWRESLGLGPRAVAGADVGAENPPAIEAPRADPRRSPCGMGLGALALPLVGVCVARRDPRHHVL